MADLDFPKPMADMVRVATETNMLLRFKPNKVVITPEQAHALLIAVRPVISSRLGNMGTSGLRPIGYIPEWNPENWELVPQTNL